MNNQIDLDALVIDGQRLKLAREERGLSVAEMAALLTMSREQVVHIEDGGNKPFYTPAHKLLAIRKYAAAMGIPYDDIVTGPGAEETMPVPEAAPASLMMHGDGEEATDLRLAAVERNADIRRRILIGVVAATVLLAIYAKVRGVPEDDKLQASARGGASAERAAAVHSDSADTGASTTTGSSANPVSHSSANASTNASATPSTNAAATNTSTALSASAGSTGAATASAPASAATTAATTPATTANSATNHAATSAAASTAATAAPQSKPVADASPVKETGSTRLAAGSDGCAAPAAGELKTWSPTYQRKADTRLFLVSPKETTVCVVDANGRAALLQLKARAGQAFTGKPPYIVQSPLLPDLEMYLQGMRVRVPSQAPALRLQPTQVTAPAADPDA